MLCRTPYNVIGELFKKDLLIFFREYPGKFLDSLLLFFTTAVVFGYFMPSGLGNTYGPFVILGAIGIFGFFEVIGKVHILLGDIEGDRTIQHTLILPIRSELVFIYMALFWALCSIALSAPLLIFGKLFLWKSFSLSQIHWPKFIAILLTANIFHGFFALWLTSVLKGLQDIGSLWFRVVNPLFMFGAYFYSWQTLYQFAPWLANLTLINPLVYVMEGVHGTALGESKYLPFSLCFAALWSFILVLGSHAISGMKKRLDCV
ncbi:MAG: hypothetical protein ACKVOH_04645 [Chlamydiales bacterium]